MYEPKLIAINYIRGLFLLDLLAALPFDLLYASSVNTVSSVLDFHFRFELVNTDSVRTYCTVRTEVSNGHRICPGGCGSTGIDAGVSFTLMPKIECIRT